MCTQHHYRYACGHRDHAPVATCAAFREDHRRHDRDRDRDRDRDHDHPDHDHRRRRRLLLGHCGTVAHEIHRLPPPTDCDGDGDGYGDGDGLRCGYLSCRRKTPLRSWRRLGRDTAGLASGRPCAAAGEWAGARSGGWVRR